MMGITGVLRYDDMLLGLATRLTARTSPTFQGKVIVHTFTMELIVIIVSNKPKVAIVGLDKKKLSSEGLGLVFAVDFWCFHAWQVLEVQCNSRFFKLVWWEIALAPDSPSKFALAYCGV